MQKAKKAIEDSTFTGKLPQGATVTVDETATVTVPDLTEDTEVEVTVKYTVPGQDTPLTTKVKVPYNLNLLENYIRAEIASFISRGSIDFRIEFEDKNENLKSLKYDEDLAKSCMQILNKMEEDFNEKFSNKLDFFS